MDLVVWTWDGDGDGAGEGGRGGWGRLVDWVALRCVALVWGVWEGFDGDWGGDEGFRMVGEEVWGWREGAL